jgi:hypothetical protein
LYFYSQEEWSAISCIEIGLRRGPGLAGLGWKQTQREKCVEGVVVADDQIDLEVLSNLAKREVF